MAGKSERLRKLEEELTNLEQWLRLGLVPKKELEKYKQEAEALKLRISEEKERLQLLKEIGHTQDYTPFKRNARGAYAENPTMGTLEEVDAGDDQTDVSDTGYHSADHDRDFERRDRDSSENIDDSYTDVSDEGSHDYTNSARQHNRNWHGLRDPDADDHEYW